MLIIDSPLPFHRKAGGKVQHDDAQAIVAGCTAADQESLWPEPRGVLGRVQPHLSQLFGARAEKPNIE